MMASSMPMSKSQPTQRRPQTNWSKLCRNSKSIGSTADWGQQVRLMRDPRSRCAGSRAATVKWRWDVRRDKYLAAGRTCDVDALFEVAKERTVEMAIAILRAEAINEQNPPRPRPEREPCPNARRAGRAPGALATTAVLA